MNPMFLLTFVLFFQTLNAQGSSTTDAEVQCSNLKGEVMQKSYFRIDKESVKVFEASGGFAFYGQAMVVRTTRGGALGLQHIPCGGDLENDTDTSLVTCASGSQIRFLNKTLPPTRQGCR